MKTIAKDIKTAFHDLTPERVINLVEDSLGVRCTNLYRPLTSYINRVCELETSDGVGLVAKFYRPGRWSGAALQDEHDFLLELAAMEIPVVPPMKLKDSKTLACSDDLYFGVFPKKSGRSFDEYGADQWLEMGRLLGRVHQVGATHLPRERITMSPDTSTREQVNYLLAHDLIPRDLVSPFAELTSEIIEISRPLFVGRESIRIHGDCHFANLIMRPDESFYIIDFDDMCVGPPVQDLWMLLPDHPEKSRAEIDFFLEGYETFRDFDYGSLPLIEPLRAMRYIHYTAWCGHQVLEDGVSRVAPDFGSRHYWQREILDLGDQLERIEKSLGAGG